MYAKDFSFIYLSYHLHLKNIQSFKANGNYYLSMLLELLSTELPNRKPKEVTERQPSVTSRQMAKASQRQAACESEEDSSRPPEGSTNSRQQIDRDERDEADKLLESLKKMPEKVIFEPIPETVIDFINR